MVLGIIISVATLTVAIAIFQGYENVLKETILGVNAHIYIFKSGEENLKEQDIVKLTDFLGEQPECNSFSELVISQAMMSREKRIKGCVIRGINWQQNIQPTNYRKHVFSGKYHLEKNNEIVLGYRLANILNAVIGDSIKISIPSVSDITPLGFKP